MIICITPNPAIDRTLLLPSLAVGNVHRAEKVIVAAGGKGLNVARAIRGLGSESLCMGFLGGHSGHLLADLARREGLNASWTWVEPETRTCTIVVSPTGDATVVNEPGLPVSELDWQHLGEDILRCLACGNLVCISGSLPPQSSADEMQRLLNLLAGAGKQVWVDTSGIALDAALAGSGACIKVNGTEIGASLGFEVTDMPSAKRALLTLGDRGIKACVITLGAEGALLATSDGRWHARGPRVRVVSTVGSGDSFLGGLVSALDGGRDWAEALRDAVAAGTANTLSAGGGQFTLQEFKDIRKQTELRAW
jgi:1-phosphofructokinase family hexose kinase